MKDLSVGVTQVFSAADAATGTGQLFYGVGEGVSGRGTWFGNTIPGA